MRKRAFTTCLSVAALTLAALTFHSCQSKTADQTNQQSDQMDDSSDSDMRDEGQMNRERDFEEEEANEEAMIHVIEIEQPAPASVTEEKAPVAPVVEIPAEAPMEAKVETVSDVPVASVVESPSVTEPVSEAMTTAASAETAVEVPTATE